MDLVRNNIFHRASAQGESAEALFEAKWRPFDRDREFWKAQLKRHPEGLVVGVPKRCPNTNGRSHSDCFSRSFRL